MDNNNHGEEILDLPDGKSRDIWSAIKDPPSPTLKTSNNLNGVINILKAQPPDDYSVSVGFTKIEIDRKYKVNDILKHNFGPQRSLPNDDPDVKDAR